jgi:hypothetical protein
MKKLRVRQITKEYFKKFLGAVAALRKELLKMTKWGGGNRPVLPLPKLTILLNYKNILFALK